MPKILGKNYLFIDLNFSSKFQSTYAIYKEDPVKDKMLYFKKSFNIWMNFCKRLSNFNIQKKTLKFIFSFLPKFILEFEY
jgi:hypothetical protein